MLEKSYFCSIANNMLVFLCGHAGVVICLKNRTFAVSQTTSIIPLSISLQLWFAWKIVLLQYRKQPTSYWAGSRYCCDLLEKSYFCSIANNWLFAFLAPRELWFAWKIVLLQYRKQRPVFLSYTISSCDLLEKSYFCSIANNSSKRTELFFWVVICLKNRTFAVSQTTRLVIILNFRKLWFAWKIVLLQYRKQQSYHPTSADIVVICLKNRTFAVSQTTRTELYFCAKPLWFAWKIVLLQYRKQQKNIYKCEAHVVICLKNRTFAVSQTTCTTIHRHSAQLWFAWKIVLLQYRKQLGWAVMVLQFCCDLLEKSYFCSIANNLVSSITIIISVVICLKNRTFAVSQTTYKWK